MVTFDGDIEAGRGGGALVVVPDDLQAALRAAGLVDRFASISFTHRKAFVVWVEEARREETRARRIGRTVEMVRAGRHR